MTSPKKTWATCMRKRSYMLGAYRWTGSEHEDVCDFMRGLSNSLNGRRIAESLVAYMKHSAPVAPTIPLDARVMIKYRLGGLPEPLVLWRGTSMSKPPVPGSTIYSSGGCFSSFTLVRQTAKIFADDAAYGRGSQKHSVPVLLRLRSDHIARGTPWAWFAHEIGNDASGQPMEVPRSGRLRQRNALWTKSQEYEVLLPPGYLKILSVSQRYPYVADVAFVPLPDHVRRGALMQVTEGGVVTTKTTAGHHLEVRSNMLSRLVMNRHRRLASSPSGRRRRRSQEELAPRKRARKV